MPSKADPTRNERQARKREARKKWLKRHGFNSMEGLMGALMNGEYVIVKAIREKAERDGQKGETK